MHMLFAVTPLIATDVRYSNYEIYGNYGMWCCVAADFLALADEFLVFFFWLKKKELVID